MFVFSFYNLKLSGFGVVFFKEEMFLLGNRVIVCLIGSWDYFGLFMVF